MMRRAQPWLGTLVEICIDDRRDDGTLRTLFDAAFSRIALVHGLMSFHDAGSDVSRINRASAGEVVCVDAHTVSVMRLAESVRVASGGAFNIACAPVLVASAHLPAPHPVAPPCLKQQAIVHCEDDTHVRKLESGWIDLGGIAKGYAVDIAIETLIAAGVQNACINAGGDMRVTGEQEWPVIIRDAVDPGLPGASLALRNEALATSATYFSLHEHEGMQTSALVDARSGTSLREPFGCSVRAASCAVADALTKVVAATGNARHPALDLFQASAFIM
ncbi:MAG TPA: FAD:protein FMN transferase [Noviherbaspirillum sp.]